MKVKPYLLLILLLPGYSVFSQNCPVPTLQKITIGTTVQETEKTLGKKLLWKPGRNYSRAAVKEAAFKNREGDSIIVDSYKNIIFAVQITYKNSEIRSDLDDFTTTAARHFSLANTWENIGGIRYFVECRKYFTLAADKRFFNKYNLTVLDGTTMTVLKINYDSYRMKQRMIFKQ